MNKTIIIYRAGRFSWKDSWPPENAVAFRDWLNAKLATIPPEHLEHAKVEIKSESTQDSHAPTIKISYERPETPEEIATRERRETERQAEREARDRETWEWLKKRFGGQP